MVAGLGEVLFGKGIFSHQIEITYFYTRLFSRLCSFTCDTLHRVSKNSQNCIHQNFVKFPPTLIIFSTKVEGECTLHNSIVLAIFMPKIIKVGGNLTKF